MMKTEGILTFVSIVESGSINAAARALRLSKSVVSDRLIELERVLGTVLLQRTTRKLTLTGDGAAFLDRARRIVQEMQEAAADMNERRGTLAGPLRLSAPVTFGRMHLGPALYPFLAQHPELELTLDVNDHRVDAVADGYDAIIRHGPIADSRLVARKLAPSNRILVASPAYLERYGAPKTLNELNNHRGIFYTNRGNADWRFQTPAGPVQVAAKLALRVNNGDMMRDATVAGLGIALLPTFIIWRALVEGVVEHIKIDHVPEAEFIYMAHQQDRKPSAKLSAVYEHLKTSFGGPPYWDT